MLKHLSAILMFGRSIGVGIGVGLGSPNYQLFNGLMATAGWLSLEIIWIALKPLPEKDETKGN